MSLRLEREISGQRYWVLYLDNLEAWPQRLDRVSGRFRLFIAADASGVSDQTLQAAARAALTQGAVYVSVWGPDCERVHDVFDRVAMGTGFSSGDATVMTTWHEEPLEEAVEFFLNAAVPDQPYSEGCNDWLAVSIGRRAWNERLTELIRDQVT